MIQCDYHLLNNTCNLDEIPDLEEDDSEEIDQQQQQQQQQAQLIYPTTYHVAIPAESMSDDPYQLQSDGLTPMEMPTNSISVAHSHHQLPGAQFNNTASSEVPEVSAASVITSTPAFISNRIREESNQNQGKAMNEV